MAYDASLGAEEKTGSLFQPDTLVPTQYLETFRGKAHLEPRYQGESQIPRDGRLDTGGEQ